MRVAVSCGSATWGGLERMAQLLCEGLSQRGHEVVLLCRPRSTLQQRVASQLPAEAVLGGGAYHPATLAAVFLALLRWRPDVVLGNTPRDPSWSGIPAHTLGIPYAHRHEFNRPYKRGLRHRFVFGRIPRVHIVNSSASRETLLASAQWLDPERVVVIPNGVDLEAIEAATPLDLGIDAGGIRFGFLGRFEDAKGIRELAAAWHRVVTAVPSAHLILSGWGPQEADLRRLLAGSPHVHWLGLTDAARVIKTLDVLVFPSHGEGFGLVLVEAMAAGVPVLAANNSSIPEIVTHDVEGWLTPTGDADALARAMVELANGPATRRRLGEAGKLKARREYSLERMLSAHERLLAEVASRAGQAAAGWSGGG